MAGVKETKEVIELAIYIGKAIKDSLSDGKIDFGDLANIMTFVPKIGPAFAAIDQVPSEIGDLDVEEIKEVLDMVKMMMPEITDDARAQAIASESLSTGLSIAKLVSVIKA